MTKAISLIAILVMTASISGQPTEKKQPGQRPKAEKKESPQQRPAPKKENGWCGACNKPNSACGR